ncbi:YdeI/OmpD-associated family protein [Pinibacter aurantiacus]|uniref:YdeI/OmpD-associated family protein n=1 Tax=Pinibacter aurantiacus TaxID=2851599 RepID=A0A9E2W582_9BACT|nr:YdeI/OmpD-associated family protein [Pinibacter aurantiacus]MBV4358383.1 YdeI/OmpD-associated family protein [Pinibacter aurantiacus]
MKNEGPVFFEKKSDFRKWLQKNHKKETELLVGFYKVGSGKPSITWPESVDEALCFGWIDAVRRSIDDESYQIRFTQRKPDSIWSAINIKKVEELTKQGLMQPAGMESFAKRTEKKSRIYVHENEEIELASEYKKLFTANKKAWKYFQSLAPSYRKLSASWVMTAKQNDTQLKRLQQLITDSEAGTNRWKDNKYKK